ncbi:tetratricopeptide repeat protein [Streptomyces xanthophaeus]
MDASRTAYIKPADPVGGSGSGYLIGPRLVLTALHVVHDKGKRAPAVTVWVGHPRAGEVSRHTGTVVWPDRDTSAAADAALILLDQDAHADHATAVRWGRPLGPAQHSYTGVGIPAFSTTGKSVQYEYLRGEIAPLTTHGRRWVLDCLIWPAASRQMDRPWAGASGTAVFTGDRLIGIITEYGTGMGEKRLLAEPVHRLLDDPAFTSVLNAYAFPGTLTTAQDLTAQDGTGLVPQWPRQFGTVPELATAYQHRTAVDDLAAALATGDTTIRADAPTALGDAAAVVTGLGGVGKTQLAVHHVHRVRKASGLPVPTGTPPTPTSGAAPAVDLLMWITATDTATITAAYAHAGHELAKAGLLIPTGDNTEEGAQGLLTWLQNTSTRWLVVLDDVLDAAVLRNLWPPASPTGRTLITTRNRDSALTEGRHQISVGLFTPDEAARYLGQRLAGIASGNAELRALADDFGHLPLALAQAAAYIRENALTLDEYRTELREVPLDEPLPGIEGLPDQQSRTVAAAWTLSIAYADTLAPTGLARPLLDILALLDPNSTPSGITASTALQHHLKKERKTEAELLGKPVAERDVKKALRVLHRLHLTDITPDQTLRTHQLLQRTHRENLDAGTIEQLAQVAADALHETWPERENPASTHYRAATGSLAARATPRLPDGNGLHAVLFQSGRTLGEVGQVTAARDYCENLLADCLRVLGPDHPDTLTTRHNLAQWSGMARDPAGAAAAVAALLPDRVRVLGADHPDTLTTRNELADWRGEAGDPAGAAAAFAELLPDRVRVLGADHPDTLTTRHNLAACRGLADDPSGAAAASGDLLADQLRILGADHPDTLTTRNDLAYWRGVTGDPDGAVAEFTALLVDRLRVLGPDHPHTHMVRNNVAAWKGMAGNAEGAAAGFADLLTDRLRVLGPDHPHTLLTRRRLAVFTGRAGHPALAVEALQELAEYEERLYGSQDHAEVHNTHAELERWQAVLDNQAGA